MDYIIQSFVKRLEYQDPDQEDRDMWRDVSAVITAETPESAVEIYLLSHPEGRRLHLRAIELPEGELSVIEFAALHAVDPGTVRQRILRGTLPARKVANRVWVIDGHASMLGHRWMKK